MKYLLILVFSSLCLSCISVRADVTTTESHSSMSDSKSLAEAGIRLVLEAQESAWNKGDIEGFMQGYWNSDQLKFYGANGLTLGWKNVLDNYKARYPSKAETGTLDFAINDISKIEGDSYSVMGEYRLTREVGDANGVFIIILKKINDEWKIIADMSC